MTRETDEGIYSKGSSIKEKKLSDMHNREELLNGLDADLFLSIHLNFFPDPSVFGAQVFYSKNKEESKEVAEAIRQSLIKLDERNDRILKKADKGIYLMEKAKIPACLVECGFLSNPTDDENLRNEEYQEKLADAIVSGIENYFNGGKYE
jgi:N-acetylmuramoyl-L-alanine amidase